MKTTSAASAAAAATTATTYPFVDSGPRTFQLHDKSNKVLFLRSLEESRASVIHGAFLTKANIVPNTLNIVGHLNLCFGIHEFPETVVAKATVLMNVRQTVMQPASRPIAAGQAAAASTGGSAAAAAAAAGTTKPVTITKSVAVSDLVFGFRENVGTYYLVPRDSTLDRPTTHGEHIKYTFLTLRNGPSGAGHTLEHQVIPVTFPRTTESERVAEVMRAHINGDAEVKDKMANAFRHIPKMAVKYLDLQDSRTPATTLAAHVPKTEEGAAETALHEAKSLAKRARKAAKREHRQAEVARARIVKQDSPAAAHVGSSSTTTTITKASVRTGGGGQGEFRKGTATSKKQKKASIIPDGWQCEICGAKTTVMRRRGPSGLNCACNSCGQAWSQANRARSHSEATKKEV